MWVTSTTVSCCPRAVLSVVAHLPLPCEQPMLVSAFAIPQHQPVRVAQSPFPDERRGVGSTGNAPQRPVACRTSSITSMRLPQSLHLGEVERAIRLLCVVASGVGGPRHKLALWRVWRTLGDVPSYGRLWPSLHKSESLIIWSRKRSSSAFETRALTASSFIWLRYLPQIFRSSERKNAPFPDHRCRWSNFGDVVHLGSQGREAPLALLASRLCSLSFWQHFFPLAAPPHVRRPAAMR